ncbi:MAG: hypothetical protein Q8L20_11090 [Gammaproteobacteria bacterium]|nr:hypothetical protein [Gammaproteobacteria bacterium]
MATTVNCDICKQELKGPNLFMMDGGVYSIAVHPHHVPPGLKKIEDICARCLAKRMKPLEDMETAA